MSRKKSVINHKKLIVSVNIDLIMCPGVPARIPSPRELAAHTQSIMQGALIKKKLEEQRENYRRRHDAPSKTPISFTPTSVRHGHTPTHTPTYTHSYTLTKNVQ